MNWRLADRTSVMRSIVLVQQYWQHMTYLRTCAIPVLCPMTRSCQMLTAGFCCTTQNDVAVLLEIQEYLSAIPKATKICEVHLECQWMLSSTPSRPPQAGWPCSKSFGLHLTRRFSISTRGLLLSEYYPDCCYIDQCIDDLKVTRYPSFSAAFVIDSHEAVELPLNPVYT